MTAASLTARKSLAKGDSAPTVELQSPLITGCRKIIDANETLKNEAA